MRLENVGEFVAWLRLPLQARDGRVAVLPSVAHHCTEATVNRKLSAVGAFYPHAARDGVEVGGLLTSWQVGGARGGWRPFLHHISKGEAKPRRVVALKTPTGNSILRASAVPTPDTAALLRLFREVRGSWRRRVEL